PLFPYTTLSRPRVGVDRADRRAVRPGQQRRGARGRADVDRVGAQVLVGLVAALREHPLDGTGPELLLQPALLLDHEALGVVVGVVEADLDRKSTRLNSSHVKISYAVFCLKKKKM